MHKLPMNVFKFHYDLKFAFRDFQILQIPLILTAPNCEPTSRPQYVIVVNNC